MTNAKVYHWFHDDKILKSTDLHAIELNYVET